MDNIIKLADPLGARAFLNQVSPARRKQGEAIFNRGGVLKITSYLSGYHAEVIDGAHFHSELSYDEQDGWLASCDCGDEFYCAHICALLLALLAEHNAATVRELSSGEHIRAAAAPAQPRGGVQGTDLRTRLMAAVGRELKPKEAEFVHKLQNLYRQVHRTERLTGWDLDRLGLFINRADWGPLPVSNRLPSSEYELWLYIANYLVFSGTPIPAFMAPITDSGAIEAQAREWRRNREVQEWKEKILRCTANPHAATSKEQESETDLRLVIRRDSAELEIKAPGDSDFRAFRRQDLTRLRQADHGGELDLTLEAEILWQYVFSDMGVMDVSLYYDADHHLQVLNRMFRSRVLVSRITDQRGEPLPRLPESLRWDMTVPESPEGDYIFRLTQADGSHAPEIFCALPGSPCLYLTAAGLIPGPVLNSGVLNPCAATEIPAAALETTSGLAFLMQHQIPLPPRLAERVRTFQYDISISCHLRTGAYGSKEECVVAVTATTDDGAHLSWNEWGWYDKKNNSAPPRNNPSYISVRDPSRLSQAEEHLRKLNLKTASRDSKLVLRVTKKFPEILTAWLKSLPPFIHVALKGELATLNEADVAGRVKLDVTETDIDWFDLRVVLDVADTTLTPQELRLLLGAKGNFVRLEGKGWRRLKFELTDDENDRLARLGLSPLEMSDEPQRLHALQLADPAARKFLREEHVAKIERRASELKARVAPALPVGVSAELRPYQLEGFHFLAYLATNRFGGILADDMGLGKTLQTLTWLLWLREQGSATSAMLPPGSADLSQNGADNPSLVVCPKSVMDNWHAEAARFTPGLRVKVWSAGALNGFADGLKDAHVHVINYSQLRLIQQVVSKVSWLALILDEGQYIKNPNSQTAQAARALRASNRLVLSGTPIENRLMDLWSLMSFTMPGVLGNRSQFGRLYDSKTDSLARRRLSARVRPFLIRRTKSQVAKDLPDRVEEDLFCELEGEQLSLYQAELKRARQILLTIQTPKELAQQQFHFLTSLLRLRQICCHPKLVNDKCNAESAKVEALIEQLEPLMEEGEKVLVFSQFVELLELLRPTLKAREWKTFYLAGQTENRGDIVREFQSAEGPAVFLISLKAGGFGLNLTAASYVVLFDPWWNPAVENQAIDRTHRIGQANKVIAYRLLIKNSIEEKIRILQKNKKALAEDVLGEERFAQSLTLEDLRFLLADE